MSLIKDVVFGLISVLKTTGSPLLYRYPYRNSAEGLRADVVLVDPAVPRVVATIAGGRIAYVTAEGAARLSLATSH